MCPNKFLRNGAIWDCTQLVKEGSLFKVYIQTVAEASVSFAQQCGLIYSEWEANLTSTVTKTGEGRLAHLLCESQRHESLFDFFLLVE